MDIIPELTSELEYVYPQLEKTNKFLNVYGPSGCGKTTIVKTYMKNRHYHYIDDYNQSFEQFIDLLKKITRVDVLSYFANNLDNNTLIIDNYDYFSFKYKDIEKYIKDFNIIIISIAKYFDKSIYIPSPSDEYLSSLLYMINHVYDKNYKNVNIDGSFLKFFSSINHGDNITFDNFYTELECLGNIYDTKNINLLLYDINNVQQTYMYYVNEIDYASYLADAISTSISFNGTEYYQCISNIIVYSLDSKITNIKNVKLNYHRRTKIQKDCSRLGVNPLELSLVKKINSSIILKNKLK